jgi:hypothetical protein
MASDLQAQALSHDHLMVRVSMTWAAANSVVRVIASPHFEMLPNLGPPRLRKSGFNRSAGWPGGRPSDEAPQQARFSFGEAFDRNSEVQLNRGVLCRRHS